MNLAEQLRAHANKARNGYALAIPALLERAANEIDDLRRQLEAVMREAVTNAQGAMDLRRQLAEATPQVEVDKLHQDYRERLDLLGRVANREMDRAEDLRRQLAEVQAVAEAARSVNRYAVEERIWLADLASLAGGNKTAAALCEMVNALDAHEKERGHAP